MKKTIVISLGGSLVVPGRIDSLYLKKFAKFVSKLIKKYRVVIVTGGGVTARYYMSAVRKIKLEEPYTSLVGIESTKLNAALVASYLKHFHLIPDSLQEVKKVLNKKGLVVCGALGFEPDMTSDGDAANIARYLKAHSFINLTNVDGLYTANPKKSAFARRIPTISFHGFKEKVDKIKFKAGQHFVLDQFAANVICKEKIETAIINGKRFKEVIKFLDGKKFIGTVIR